MIIESSLARKEEEEEEEKKKRRRAVFIKKSGGNEGRGAGEPVVCDRASAAAAELPDDCSARNYSSAQ